MRGTFHEHRVVVLTGEACTGEGDEVWAHAGGGLFGDGGVYGGCIQDAVGNFTKKGLTFWSRDLFVALFMAIFAGGGSGGSGGEL